VFKAPDRLINRPAFNAEYNLPATRLNYFDHLFPVNHPVTTGTSHRSTGDLSPFSIALRQADILGMEMNQPAFHSFEPLVNIRTTCKITVSCIKINTDCRGGPGWLCCRGHPAFCCIADAVPALILFHDVQQP
jgi:hypothetical protein